MKNLIITLSFLIVGCGARKVDKRQVQEESKTETKEVVKNDLTTQTNTLVTTTTKTDEKNQEEIEETVLIPIDNNKPLIFGQDTLTNAKLVKRKIKRNKALNLETNTNIQNEAKQHDKGNKTTIQSKQTKKNEQTKSVNQKQFDPLAFIISYWWLWLILFLVYLGGRKLKYF